MQIITGALCVRCGLKDGALVALQYLEPEDQVSRMIFARLSGNAQIGAEKCRTQLGDLS